MKFWITVLALVLLYSCKSQPESNPNEEIDSDLDTLPVEYFDSTQFLGKWIIVHEDRSSLENPFVGDLPEVFYIRSLDQFDNDIVVTETNSGIYTFIIYGFEYDSINDFPTDSSMLYLHPGICKCEGLEIRYQKVPFEVYKYNKELQTDVLTYQYADLWDIDGDNIMDSIAFIGNGGAHQYLHFEIKISSETSWRKHKGFLIDMPWITQIRSKEDIDDLHPQFGVFDFDDDGVEEVYLNVDPYMELPVELFNLGINSRQIIMDYQEGELVIEGYEKFATSPDNTK